MKAPMIIIAAPSGAGKSSFVKKIIAELEDLRDTITYTTREMRRGESEGEPYHFVSQEKFNQLIKEDFFVEWAQVHGNLYGTPLYQIEEAWEEGKTVIMDVDVQGAKTFKSKYPEAATIFIIPPSIQELRRRVVDREGEPPADLELRMKNAEVEMAHADSFDHQLVNDDFEESYGQFRTLIYKLLEKTP